MAIISEGYFLVKNITEGRGVSPVPSEAKTKEISGLKIKDWKESTEYENLEIYQQVS